MNAIRTFMTCTGVILALLASTTSQAMPENVRKLRLKDQHELPYRIPSSTRYIIFAHDMSSKNLVQDMLSSKPDSFLQEHDAVFIADISGMPRVIARMFAYPSLRKLPYKVLLDELGTQTGEWDRKDSAVTLLTVADYEVTGFSHIDQVEDLLAALVIKSEYSGDDASAAAENSGETAAEQSVNSDAE